MAGFFVRLVVVDDGGAEGKRKFKIGEKSTGDVLFAGSQKVLKPGMKGDPVKPRFLGMSEDLKEPLMPKDFKEPVIKGKVAPPKPAFSRKEKLAEWVVAKTIRTWRGRSPIASGRNTWAVGLCIR